MNPENNENLILDSDLGLFGKALDLLNGEDLLEEVLPHLAKDLIESPLEIPKAQPSIS